MITQAIPTTVPQRTATTRLSAAELAAFRAKGYHVVRGLFDPNHMERLAVETEGLHARMAAHAPEEVDVSWEEGLPDGRPPRIRQLMHSERVSPIIDTMSRSDEILDILEQLIGPDIYLFHSKLMMKAAHDGTFTPWHQDWGYWQYGNIQPSQVNCMLAIDAADEENGSIRFVDGSHLQGPVDHARFASSSFSIGLEGGLDAFPSTLLEFAPGDAVFFGPLVIHGSGPNASARDRRANTFAFDRCGNQKNGELPERMHRRGAR
ncbi:MAG: phytanoyl-CoA dioxygenase family protein [Planctomycetes bacterium]|nr:phytanoyl-CoA dioxygenase family protein [Planctomycetota bacterium]